jgi:POT family proton-dependent oligopeptide transporter
MLQTIPTEPAAGTTALAPGDRSFFGHPRGLATLFFTEMWERFSYYGMRAILSLFMVATIAEGGLGFSKAEAAIVYGLYTSLVYLLPLAGGWLADNFLGMRRAVLCGGIVIMVGHVLLAFHGTATFYGGLACVVIGTGFLKPNISAIVGQLYTEKDARRDAGFSIFYMGINLGAGIAPIICGWLAQSPAFKSRLEGWGIDPKHCWHWGFGAAAVGMFLGLVQYVATGHFLGTAGRLPAEAQVPEARARARRTLGLGAGAVAVLAVALAALAMASSGPVTKAQVNGVYTWILFGSVGAFFAWLLSSKAWSAFERRRLVVVALLFVGSCVFWAVFEQAGNTLTFFADEKTRNSVFGWSFQSSQWQSVQPALIVLMAPLFAWLWTRLGNFDRSSGIRFAVGILFAGLGFAILIGGALEAGDAERASPLWLFTVYLFHTIGELCLSPVGLSSMTKFAPQRVQGLMLGVWFASISVGTFLGSQVAGVYEQYTLPKLFLAVAAGATVMAIVMAVLVRPMTKLVDAKP